MRIERCLLQGSWLSWDRESHNENWKPSLWVLKCRSNPNLTMRIERSPTGSPTPWPSTGISQWELKVLTSGFLSDWSVLGISQWELKVRFMGWINSTWVFSRISQWELKAWSLWLSNSPFNSFRISQWELKACYCPSTYFAHYQESHNENWKSNASYIIC